MTNPTDSDRATAERIVEEWREGRRGLSVYGDALALRDAIAAALAAEREACAGHMDRRASAIEAAGGNPIVNWMARIYREEAAAIRARSNPNEEK